MGFLKLDDPTKKEFIDEYLTNLNLEREKDFVFLYHDDLAFQVFIDRAIGYVYLQGCEQCPVDCNKRLPLALKSKADKYLQRVKDQHVDFLGLEEVTFDQLTKIAMLKESPKKYVDVELYDGLLKKQLHEMKFFLIGYERVGKTSIFNLLPGVTGKSELIPGTLEIENRTFPPFKIKLFDLPYSLTYEIISNRMAPMYREAMRDTYMFILVVDSTAKNALNTKSHLLKPLNATCPSALFICLANKQDKEGAMDPDSIRNLLKLRVYGFTAIKPKCRDLFNNIIFETVLIRIEQLKEHDCPHLK